MTKNSFLNFNFMDDDPEDHLIGGGGHLDGIIVPAYEDSISYKLESTF